MLGTFVGHGPAILLLAALPLQAGPPAHRSGANRLAHVDEIDPYWPDVHAPKLTTPMWIGPEDADAGVEAAIVLSIDDMRDPAPYAAFLQPILERLQQIESAAGRAPRAPMSIFTCTTAPRDPQQVKLLKRFLADGVSLECHTVDHPCPLFRGGDLELAKQSYLPCVDLLASVADNEAVGFRMPCCDSLNTNSPRFYSQLLPLDAHGARHLPLDSSVQNVFTSDDPALPRELVQEADGSERFLKYLPRDRRFANCITNYPYPYVIANRCFELPWSTPTDWQAQHLRGPNQEQTVADLEAALDLTVLKQGLFTLVFHPHGWIRNDQIVALIDHAVAKWGSKVRFLSVRDVKERLEKNVHPFADLFNNFDPLLRFLDVDGDGLLDFIAGRTMGRWRPTMRRWEAIEFPVRFGWKTGHGHEDYHPQFGVVHGDGRVSVLFRGEKKDPGEPEAPLPNVWAGSFDGSRWIQEPELLEQLDPQRGRRDLDCDGSRLFTALVAEPHADSAELYDGGVRLLDLDGDGRCELIVSNRRQNGVFRFDPEKKGWRQLTFELPSRCSLAPFEPVDGLRPQLADGTNDGGVRLLDLDEDGDLDLVASGTYVESATRFRESAVWLFESLRDGWTRPLSNVAAPLASPASAFAGALPLIARADGTNNGMWVQDRALWWVNEDTDQLPGHCDRRGFDELLAPAFPIGTEPPPRPADASLRSLHLRPGFTAQLVAAEPLVMDPICIEWGADGRLWVVEMGDYPIGASGPDGSPAKGGRVKFLEDRNGDGVYDRATTFLDGLSFATSVLPWRDGVLITAAPDLIFAADRDGDGRADVREVLFTGFGEGNPQHRVNGLRLGLDGFVHGANGDSDGEILCVATGERVDISGRDWRCDPDHGVLEPVTGGTQYGRDRDDFDDWFGGNNSTPAWHFLLEERYLLRNPFVGSFEPRIQVPAIPGAQPVFPASITRARFNDLDTANHFTSACSPAIYRDDLFGPAFSASLFVCEPVHNLVHREAIARAGVTFASRRAADESTSEFLASSDPWFRPVQARTGPDGALWVVDMYRDVIEHPEWIPEETQRRLDLRAGADRGRIYRVFPVDRAPRPIRRLDRASADELADVLRSPNGWTRDTAQRLLVERKAAIVAPRLAALAGDATAAANARVQALATLDALDALSSASLRAALADRDAEVARFALRVAEPRLAREPATGELIEILAQRLAADAPPALLLQCALSLGESPLPAAGAVLGELLHRARAQSPFDRRTLETAIASSLRAENLASFLAAVRAHGSGPGQEEGGELGDLAPGLVRLAVHTGQLDAAERLVDDAAASPVDWSILAPRALALREQLVAEGRPLPPKLLAIVERARAALRDLGSGDAVVEGTAPAVALLGGDEAQLADDLALLARLLDPSEPSALSLAAAERLAALDDERVSSLLIARWRSASPDLRRALLAAFLQREERLPALFAAIEAGTIAARDLDGATRQRLLQHDDDTLRARAEQAFATRIDPDRAAVVAAFRPALELAGERARGQLVFERKCSTCHLLRGIGHAVGPDLATMSDQSAESLLVAMLDPNRAVEGRYVAYSAITKSGDIHAGILVEESAASITVRESGGKDARILRGDLAALRSSAKSLMVEGLEGEATPQDFADVIAFLQAGDGSGQVRRGKRVAGNEPAVVRPMGECGALHLTAATAEIHGPQLTFEARYGNLGWWQSAEDFAAWDLEPACAATCDVIVDFACDASAAGGTLILALGDQELAFAVPSTGTWNDYREQTIGTFTLAAGAQRLIAKPRSAPASALIDLREVRLVPRPP